jgi:hypothetical protein
MTNSTRKRHRPNKANWHRGFKFEGSSVKRTGPATSPSGLATSNFTLRTPAVRNKANLPGTDRNSRRPTGLEAKRSQFPHGEQWAKAASAVSGAHRAKRSQFPEAGGRDRPGTDNCESRSRCTAGRRRKPKQIRGVASPKLALSLPTGPASGCEHGCVAGILPAIRGRDALDTARPRWPQHKTAIVKGGPWRCHPDPPFPGSAAPQSAPVCRPHPRHTPPGRGLDLAGHGLLRWGKCGFSYRLVPWRRRKVL